MADAMEPDPLSDVLRTVRLTGALFFLWHVSWPYAMPVPAGRAFAPLVLPGAQQIISYHVVTQGECWGALVGESPVRLEAGDILLIPHGDAYVMSSSAQTCKAGPIDMEPSLQFFRQMAAGALPFVVEDGGGEPTSTHLICGFLGCDVRPFNPALAALPRLVHLRAPADATRDRLQSLIDYTLTEARRPRPGGQCVLVRLSELMFIEVVRRWLAEAEANPTGATPPSNWLAGLRDPLVGRALMLLHREPAAPWTLETLASEVGASRSRLAESFTRFVGQPPMQYLTQWRLQLAARMLADSAVKVAAVARDFGYESEASFSRAFKRFVGVSPAQWRRETIANRTQPSLARPTGMPRGT
ncbi:MAG TPA: AraC family transcriptional regulator [Burkholderiaceae bacterium]|nr:AraC family transcriptional regulator [Burkholderiaceae bacterium]